MDFAVHMSEISYRYCHFPQAIMQNGRIREKLASTAGGPFVASAEKLCAREGKQE